MKTIHLLNGKAYIGENVIIANEEAAATSITAYMLCAANAEADAKVPRIFVFADYRIKTTDDPHHADILRQAAACSTELADAIIATSYLPGPFVDGVPTAKVIVVEVPCLKVAPAEDAVNGAYIVKK